VKPCRGDVGPRLAVCPPTGGYRSIYNYRGDAGAGSNTITVMSESPGWRAALLGTVAAGALWLGLPRYARAGPDACDVSVAGVATCQGDQSDGIDGAGAVPPNFNQAITTTLNVNNLTADIAPLSGVDGIYFHRTGALNNIVINSDTTPFDIIVTGANADGIDALSDAAVTITHTGDIDASAGRRGISAELGAGTALTIITTGDVTAGTSGIFANSAGLGALTVTAKGDVIGTTSRGIYARNNNVNSTSLSITSEGVTGGVHGIFAFNRGTGALSITANGDVAGTSTFGIYAENANALGTGPLTVTSEGVTGGFVGIFARNNGTGAVTVTAHGDVEGTSDTGIDARNYGLGALTIEANGNVMGGSTGIFALNDNAAGTGPLSITTEGKVTGGAYGIRARNFGTGALTIEANGDVEGTGNVGIYARNYTAGPGTYLSITTGAGTTVTGGTYGIFALNQGSYATTVVAKGDVEGGLTGSSRKAMAWTATA
jgi:hypothetical protein